MNWWAVISGVLLFLVTAFTIKLTTTKRLLREVAEALTILSEAVEDDRITDEERANILDAWGDVIVAARDLAGR